MSRKSIFEDTDIDIIISNLRGEVGEIVQTWLLMRDFYFISGQMQTDDIENDMNNQDLGKVNLIKKKFQNDLISRLSEIGIKKKYGRVNFYFAANKLNRLKTEVDVFDKFLGDNKFRDRRNEFISHKQLPKTWNETKAEQRISYMTLLRGVAFAHILMKRFDMIHLGKDCKYQWYEMRKRRYDFRMPAKSAYFMLPYIVIDK